MDEIEIQTSEILEVEIPTRVEAEREAKVLCMKLLLSPQTFTLTDLARLHELMIAEGYMD